MLGKKPSIQSGGKIQIVVENGIRRAGTQDLETAETLTGVFSTVTLHPSAVSARRENCIWAKKSYSLPAPLAISQVAVPRYRIIPSNPTCDSPVANSVAEIRIVPEDGRELNVSVRITFNGNENQDQRRNMLLWRTIRDLGDQLQQQQSREGGSNRLSINTTLVRPLTQWISQIFFTKLCKNYFN
jgi:hypothetical protein